MSFFVEGEAAKARHIENAERDRRHAEEQLAKASAIEAQIAAADSDREAAQLVAMAQLLHPDCWASRHTWFEMAERERISPRANDPLVQANVQRFRNMAATSVEYSLYKAQQAIDLVRSWGE